MTDKADISLTRQQVSALQTGLASILDAPAGLEETFLGVLQDVEYEIDTAARRAWPEEQQMDDEQEVQP